MTGRLPTVAPFMQAENEDQETQPANILDAVIRGSLLAVKVLGCFVVCLL